MVLKKIKASLICTILIFLLTASIAPTLNGNIISLKNNASFALNIDYLSTDSAYPGDTVSIYGSGFGTEAGYVILTGLKIEADAWSDTEIIFTVTNNSATGFIYVRDSNQVKSNSVSFSVDRTLPVGQFEPYGFQMEDIGLLGSAFLVETDGSYFYGVSGFETLCTYEIIGDGSYNLCSRIYLPQRIGDIKIHNDYLFLTGDHGLLIYRRNELQNNNPEVVAAISGGSFLTLDIKEKNGSPINGTLFALCEYIPIWGTDILRVPLYNFEFEELIYLGCYTRTVSVFERYHAIAIDPMNPKVYVSGLETLLGNDKYILELDITNPSDIQLNYRLETGGVLAFDMDVIDNILWTGVVATGTIRFQIYNLISGSSHLSLAQTVTGPYRLGRATRVKIIDESITVGSSWSGERPDVYLMDTFSPGTQPLATDDSLDWAFDVTGYSITSDANEGKIIVADEWGGFITYDYTDIPSPLISHNQDYNWVVAGAMTQEIYITDERLFVADRGAGVWSIDSDDLSDESSWRWVDWEWAESEPQPHPISALCTKEDETYGTLIAALGHDKAMAWGSKIYGILYKETVDDIEFLAISDEIDPATLYSTGISVIWPETDLAYMITGSDGFRAYVINPDVPSIELHKDCQTQGFGTDSFSTSNLANCMVYYEGKIIIGSKPGLLMSSPTLHIYDVSYPEEVPDRNNPDRKINIIKSAELKCLKYKDVNHIDITPSGLIALSTSQGAAVLDILWIPQLNAMSDQKAWDLIKIPDDTYKPWWKNSWTSFQADARFSDDSTLYVVKNPEGLWRLDLETDDAHYTHNIRPAGFYPGVQCGINYSQLLHGWQNPDIITIHHPYGLTVENDKIFVHGWSGKVNALSFDVTNNCPSKPNINGPTNGNKDTEYDYTFSSTDLEGQKLFYYIDWGDGNIEQWLGPYNSGQTITISHTWTKTGTYQVKAKALDENNGVSYWGKYEVTMPRNKEIQNSFYYEIFEWLIDFFPFIKYVFEYLT
ncbi:hypothetical protein AYK24_00925 [Thermoplasmatales archaeon SG8-52-4]|nr:MAG: hypothetical protein AYK24_00925 [Thermoplasmatales archaeon SG8-52-4]